jgi:murein hydrolase activator
MLGGDSTARFLLSMEDPGPSTRMMRYYSIFNAERLERIGTFHATLQELDATLADIDAASITLQQTTAALEAQLEALEANRVARVALLRELEAERATRSGELENLAEDRHRLESLIEEINRIVEVTPPPGSVSRTPGGVANPRLDDGEAPAARFPFAQARRQLPWPLDGPLLNRFGARYSEGNLQRQGIIIGAAEGSPVRAVHDGRVVFSDWLRGSGLLVVLDHGEGYLTLYGHNQTLARTTGDWVNRGEVIGTAGADAGLASPGIYFEIRHNGQAQDPVSWCITQ